MKNGNRTSTEYSGSGSSVMVIGDDIFSLKSFDVIVMRDIRLGIESSISGYISTLSEYGLNIEYILYIVYYIEDGDKLI